MISPRTYAILRAVADACGNIPGVVAFFEDIKVRVPHIQESDLAASLHDVTVLRLLVQEVGPHWVLSDTGIKELHAYEEAHPAATKRSGPAT